MQTFKKKSRDKQIGNTMVTFTSSSNFTGLFQMPQVHVQILWKGIQGTIAVSQREVGCRASSSLWVSFIMGTDLVD